jgi:hypothetical protein
MSEEKEAFAKKVQKIMGNTVPSWIPRGEWQGKPYNHIFADLRTNFIDGRYPTKCYIKGRTDENNKDIKYHKYASHMNSSQVMCISFFKKFFEKEEYENLLLEILRKSGIHIVDSDKIAEAIFEYEPNSDEGTNFDFYLTLTSNIRLSFEIKYTEPAFGGISPDSNEPDKYDRKWNTIYRDMVDRCPFLNIEKENFYKNYQINRNISYAKEGDCVLFLTPKANDAKGICSGRDYIDSFQNDHILNLYWEDVVEITRTVVKDIPELEDYYSKFYKKYIKIFKEI